MEIGAFVKSLIYLVSGSLLYPVLFLLVFLIFYLLIYCGSFFIEWLDRSKITRLTPKESVSFLCKKQDIAAFPYYVRCYIEEICSIKKDNDFINEIEIEDLLQGRIIALWKSLDRIKMVIRIGPGLGLIGTLIPMGTGLAGLSQGDMTRLSSDLVIAFTTTVVGLAVGLTAYFFYTVKRRWVEEDIKDIELITEIFAFTLGGEKEHEIS